MGCFLTLVIILQVYIVLTFWEIQGLYLHQVTFVQRLHLTLSSYPLNHKFTLINIGSVFLFWCPTSILLIYYVVFLLSVFLFTCLFLLQLVSY